MGGWVPIAEVELECPFCGKKGVTAKYIPPSIQAHTSRSAAGSKTQIHRVRERYEGISGCKFCGKSDKEVIKAMKEGKDDVEKEKRILERLRQQGIIKDEITAKF
jgi:glyoxylate utilization-related uncharacterized protein